MQAESISDMAERVAALMERRLRARGGSVPEKLERGGRALPRRIRPEAEILVTAARQATNPRLLVQIDRRRVTRAHDICLEYLQTQPLSARWRAAFGRMAVNFCTAGLVVAAVLWWRSLP